MRKVIFIGGVLASGKSTYAKIIQDKFNLTIVTKDKLKELLGNEIYVANREENKKLSVISFEIIKYLLSTNMSTLVIESNFKPYEMVELKKICESFDYKVLSLVFDGSNEILHKRFNDRLKENRHYVHKSQDFTNINDFIPVLEELRNVQYFGEIIKVNCDDFTYQTDNNILKIIEEFLNE